MVNDTKEAISEATHDLSLDVKSQTSETEQLDANISQKSESEGSKIEEPHQDEDDGGVSEEELDDGEVKDEVMDDDDTKTLLWSILDSVVTEGTFATGNQLPDAFPPSLLRVDGVGRIAFPLCPEQAVTLKAACSISPFGRGHDTVIDTNVRRSVEAPADKVHLSPAWTAAVNQLAIDACEKLDLSFAVDAHLYKQLLYEAGDFFLEHQDTEKEPGMFGTLLVQLPAEHTGGHLDTRCIIVLSLPTCTTPWRP
ncbi:hypothetical protein SDRG_16673 [Saprolegnia diclina VS20]|uniref:Prolyl 4-hydroxylase alpha subunit Fe(2+) 2OG dioxygenase domain-containing protein n=1 Tax=Saprolegnia diclina (strain VS20) TaxID=1156394 RepID=T0PJC6_SAPDV|nr:hypothetical protein SDRG_16673 [Saprolegnia diclina VS20]EQC25454.1 hypothetical protein SDRG_16673 [Saprolegnia diclina VS20]|eukprot:XP_008621113.1 hypothetical protein SDRG_16673 [Saprolegnia diclina VS20]